jgi:hypothetical protein
LNKTFQAKMHFDWKHNLSLAIEQIHMLRMIALGLVGILFMLNWLTLLVVGATTRVETV